MSLRLTLATRLVLGSLHRADRVMYGLEIMRDTGLPSGTVYPVLARLDEAGWTASQWELLDPAVAGRPPRRYYTLTPVGAEQAADVGLVRSEPVR